MPGAASHQFPLAPGLLNAPYVLPASAAASLVSTEGGATAFKAPAGGYQNTPGTGYNDAGFTSPQFNSPLQDFGTRLTAVFKNVPAGVRVFVSTHPISAAAGTQTAVGTANSFQRQHQRAVPVF